MSNHLFFFPFHCIINDEQFVLFSYQLKSGAELEDVWKDKEVLTEKSGSKITVYYSFISMNFYMFISIIIGPFLGENGDVVSTDDKEPRKRRASCLSEFDFKIESLLLEGDIDQILQSLKKSQESEYKIAEEALITQKNLIQYLYRELDNERSEYSAGVRNDDGVRRRIDQIKKEIQKLEEMKAVADGFGRTPKRILKEHYDLEAEKI